VSGMILTHRWSARLQWNLLPIFGRQVRPACPVSYCSVPVCCCSVRRHSQIQLRELLNFPFLRQRDRERDRETDRDRDRETETERQSGRDRKIEVREKPDRVEVDECDLSSFLFYWRQ
jgi:hypothetical protein